MRQVSFSHVVTNNFLILDTGGDSRDGEEGVPESQHNPHCFTFVGLEPELSYWIKQDIILITTTRVVINHELRAILILLSTLGNIQYMDYAFTHNGRAIIASSNKFSDLYFTRKPFRALSFCHLDTSIQCPSQNTLSYPMMWLFTKLRILSPLFTQLPWVFYFIGATVCSLITSHEYNFR